MSSRSTLMLPSLSPPGCGLGVVIGGCAVQAMVSAQKSTRQQHSILLGEACGALYGNQLATALGFQRTIFFLRLIVSNSPLFSFTRTILTTTLTSLLETSLF
uniref:Uncharacterized protein n=1 Tax=Populus trichocarpa TaxID=3694 RepID=A0A2K2AU84_POPTR